MCPLVPLCDPIPYYVAAIILSVGVAAMGVWSASQVAQFLGVEDPQFVVIDEVSGQMLTLLFALGAHFQLVEVHYPFFAVWPRWKYYLLGFILFRVFDIWKPFPARQAESLPGGWGIMADDWIAAIYAALGLWIARYLGL
jgi:phosphatidylglycerophosphatase A